MLYDRDYMRASGGSAKGDASSFFKNLSITKRLILINAAVYVLDLFLRNFTGSDILVRYFGLSFGSLEHFKFWSLISYSFLHAGILHLGVNMLVLYLAGSQLEERIGGRKTLIIYLASVLGGALFFMAASVLTQKGFLVGASAGVIGVLSAFLLLMENRVMRFLFFFVIPLNLRPRPILIFMLCIELFGFLFFEIAPHSGGSGVGYSAHLGGMAAGVLCILIMEGKFANFSLPKFGRRKVKRKLEPADSHAFRVDILDESALRAEVNRILDKINQSGFSSLSDGEKRTLQIAKEKLK